MGLIRTRSFCLADAHIICRPDQVVDELNSVFDLIEFVAKTIGLAKGKDYHYRLSLGDRKDTKKYFKDDAAWDEAEKILRDVLVARKDKFVEAQNEAAFYGPKVDIQMVNANGKEETAFTVQYDFVMPKRFNLTYINEKGEKEEAVVIHRSSIGAIERSIAFLIEKYKGAFPVWLSPVQVKILPITENNLPYARQICENLEKESIRVKIDDKNATLQAKIRDAQLEKVPYMLVIGNQEEKAKKVAVRQRDGQDLGQIDLEKFLTKIKEEIATKA
jgi:threonyl-tRNA synthetase